jgi:2-hydroxychromene-2-carboxylate isomerase
MMQRVDMYWSHNSPYCYLALDRILQLRRRPDVDVVLRLVLPGLMRNGDRFADASQIEQAYFLQDAARTAAFLGVPFGWPRPWPVAFVDGNLYRAVPEQPRAWRLYHLNAAAQEKGRGWDFLDQVSRLIWDGTTENWQEDAVLRPAVERAGLDYDVLCRRAEEGAEAFTQDYAGNHEALLAAGHWGVPVFVVDGEPFYGQDRFDQLLWRLDQAG